MASSTSIGSTIRKDLESPTKLTSRRQINSAIFRLPERESGKIREPETGVGGNGRWTAVEEEGIERERERINQLHRNIWLIDLVCFFSILSSVLLRI